MKFVKYHGLGNDYLVMRRSDLMLPLTPTLITRICHRNLGIGSDGIILLEDDTPAALPAATFIVRVLNPDGSEAENSGNGMRIVARYLYDTGAVGSEPCTLLVKGERIVRARIIDPQHAIEIDLGAATFKSAEIPAATSEPELLNYPLTITDTILTVHCVNLGNPHCVVFNYPDLREGAHRFGPILEHHPLFPQRINVQFARVLDRHTLEIEIWERGAGYTLASGTSSSAVACVARKLGLVEPRVTVQMPGGTLAFEIDPTYQVRLTGPVVRVGSGEIAMEGLG
jgi:diaminopimelate epimerase